MLNRLVLCLFLFLFLLSFFCLRRFYQYYSQTLSLSFLLSLVLTLQMPQEPALFFSFYESRKRVEQKLMNLQSISTLCLSRLFLHFRRPRTKMYSPLLLPPSRDQTQLPRRQPQQQFIPQPFLESHITFLPHFQLDDPTHERGRQEWVSNFFRIGTNDSIVSAQVSGAESREVHLEFVDQESPFLVTFGRIGKRWSHV